jgi:DNA-binding GntR family transcriptional regulator
MRPTVGGIAETEWTLDAPSSAGEAPGVGTPVLALPGIESDTLQRRTYRALRHALMAGILKPGQAVTLRTLAASLGTSAMPVRDAVNRLIAERALVMLPNRSVIVPRMTRARFEELSRARQALEGLAAEAACAHMTPEILARLSTINHALKRCVTARDHHGALAGNMSFHFTLYEAGRTEVILPLIETLWLQAGPFMALAVTIPGVRWAARHHQAAMAMLRDRDAAAVRRAIELDIEDSMQELLRKASFDDEPS